MWIQCKQIFRDPVVMTLGTKRLAIFPPFVRLVPFVAYWVFGFMGVWAVHRENVGAAFAFGFLAGMFGIFWGGKLK